MKYLYLIIIFLSPLVSSAASSSTPDNIFIDYYKTGNVINISFSMPYGNNGKYLFIDNKGKVFASSTLTLNTPFTQSDNFKYKFDKPGSYEIKALLCSDINKNNCATSTPLSFVYKNNEIIDESMVDEGDITIIRKRMIDERKDKNYANYIISNINRTNNLKVDLTKDYLNKENVKRVKKILGNSNLSSVIEGNTQYRSDDFLELVSKYPSFCNEITKADSKDILCARELSAYFAILLWYTNNEVKSVYSGMNNREKLSEIFGNKSWSSVSDKEIFESLLQYYMTDRNPEPSIHSAMTYGFLINDNDFKSNIVPGFGAAQNIITHGHICNGKNIDATSKMADLYKKLLIITKEKDNNVLTCNNQKPFSILSNSFYPQYPKTNPYTNKCELELIETNYLNNCKINDLNNVASDAVIKTKIIKNNYLKEEEPLKVDNRIKLGKNIAITYSYKNAYDNLTQIPYNKINSIIYEDAYVDGNGNLKFNDNYFVSDKLFKGDCFRIDCKRGFLNNLKSGKQINKDLKIILDIRVDDVTIFKTNKNIDTAIKQIFDLIQSNNFLDGVTLTISNLKNESDSDYVRKFIASLKTKWQGLNKTIGIRLYPNNELISFFNLKPILPMISDVYLLAYDIHTPKEKMTQHSAQIITLAKGDDNMSMASLLINLKDKGVDKRMVSIGVPLFGRIWSDVVDNKKKDIPGMFVLHKSDYSKSYITYKDINDYYLLHGNFKYYEDKLRQASYLYDGKTLITYDSPEMIEKKVGYLFNDGYKGVILSDASSDNGDLLEGVLNSIKKGSMGSCVLERKIKSPLKLGSVGADVYALQAYLKCKGYLPSYFEINGNYNSETMNAVKLWQADNKIKNTGVFDINSITLINR